jgi:arylsulfatase A-like enzyme
MTGMSAARHRVTDWTLWYDGRRGMKHPKFTLPEWNYGGICTRPDQHHTVHARPLPAILKTAGYRTIHVGKAHFGAVGAPGADPKHLGFDVNIAGYALGSPGSYYGEDNFRNRRKPNTKKPTQKKKTRWPLPNMEKYHGQKINLSEALTREAIREIDDSLSADRPFFLYLAHYAVHAPIMPDRRFVNNYPDLDPKEAAYASMVEGMDRSLGDVMDHLKEKGIDQNTAILFMSDNGGLSVVHRGGTPHTHNRPLASGKGSAYEGGIREPMLVRWPGVTRPGSTCETPVIIEDFFTTVLDIAGVALPQNLPQTVDGVSFVPLLKGEVRPADQRALFWHYPNWWGPTGPGIGSSSTIRRGDWKLIYFHDGPRYELFNLANDLGETKNLADVETEKRDELAAELKAYLQKVQAQMPRDKKTDRPVPLP